jgi:hypothetical protein
VPLLLGNLVDLQVNQLIHLQLVANSFLPVVKLYDSAVA